MRARLRASRSSMVELLRFWPILLLSPVYEWLVRENARFCALFQAQRGVKSWV